METAPERGRVLLVGRSPASRRPYREALAADGFSVRCEAEPVDWPIEESVACLVLVSDEAAKESTETIEEQRIETVHEHRPDIPVIVVGPDDGQLAGTAVAAGASQYVPRTLEDSPAVLVDRVRPAIESTAPPTVTADGGDPVSTLDPAAERRLKERAMDEAPVGITIADAQRPDTPLIYANAAFERVTGYPPEATLERNCRFLQGEATDPAAVDELRDAIEAEEPITVELQNYRRNGDPFWNEVTIAPVRNEAGVCTHFVGFQDDVTERKEAELALDRERQRLEHLLGRINGLLETVHADLVTATSREAIETTVCDRLAADEAYAWCLIARPDSPRNALEVSAWSGTRSDDSVSLSMGLTGDALDGSPLEELIVETFETGGVSLLEESAALDTIAETHPWLPEELSGVAAIPLTYRETCYGVLAIGALDATGSDDREHVVLESIARATATAINAVERGRLLSSDAVTELAFECTDPDLFLVDLSARIGGEVVYDGGIFQDDGSGQLFCTVSGDPDAIESATEALEADTTLVTTYDQGALLRVTVEPGSIVGRITERGGSIRSMTASDGVCTITLEVPATTDARAVALNLEERYPAIELRSVRERDRPPATRQSFVSELRDRLTERQRTALTAAYASGFYEWDRSVSGDELADSMGITRSTFHQHRRAAERKLIAAVIGDGTDPPAEGT